MSVSMLGLVSLPGRLGAAPALRFARVSVEQGLSQSTVQAILQDHIGFLWFGTEEGLNRYDGYSFVVFKHDPKEVQSLPDNVVSALYEDREHRLWVGTEHGLCSFDRRAETFTRDPSILDRVTSIVEGPDGTLWVGAEGGGLFLRDPVTGAFASYQPDPREPASLVSFRVSALLFDHRDRLWIGARNGGVDLFEPTGQYGRFIHHRHDPSDPRSLADDEVWGLAEDASGNLWVATHGGGMSVLDQKTGAFRHYRHRQGERHGLPTDLMTCVFVDRSGTVWVGTDGAGILRYDPDADRFVSLSHNPGDPASLSQNVVRTITEDVQGQLWVGTYLGGVNLLRKPRHAFGYLTHNPTDPSSLSDPSVACFVEDSGGDIWIGTERGWLNRYDQQTGSFVRHRFPSEVPGGSAVLSLHKDRRGRIWAGSYRGGLARFDPERGSFATFKHRDGDPASIGNDEVWAIAEDADGALWLGTNAGLDRFDAELGAAIAHYQTPTAGGLSFAGVRSLLVDREGNLWVGSLGGLNLLRRGSSTFVLYQHDEADPHSLSNDAVVSLREDSRGRLWVGTLGGGLNLLDVTTGRFSSYKEFPSNVIFGIEEDSSGRLWSSTNHGLSRFDPETGSTDSFDLANGLQSLQFHMGAALRTRGGRVLFGSIDGFYDFDPDSIKPDSFAPAVVFTLLRISNEPVKLNPALPTRDEITLAPEDKIFSIEFAALEYSLPRRNRYAYLMEGFSDKWVQLEGRREFTFTNLDPGTYVFRVKATNNDGVWIEKPAALRVIVQPPFWRTWWFRGLAVVVFALALLAAHRVRVRRLTADISERKRAELALRQAEEKYRRLFEEDLSADVISTPAGRVLACNPAFISLFGFASVEDAMSCSMASLYPGAEGWDGFVQRVRQQKRLEYYEAELRRRDGGLLNVIANVIGVFGESGELIEIRGYIFDNTEHRKLEQQLFQSQKMEAIGRLAGGVAHDFNNWLTPIIGYSQLLLRAMEPGDPKRKEVEEISKAGERASAVASQLLAFSRKQVLQPRVLDPNQIVAGMHEMLRRLIREDIELVTRLDSKIGRVKADPGQLEQVILNLALNARDAMPKGGKLTIETANVEFDQFYARQHLGAETGPCVMLAVNDTGCGMDAETQTHIFEPFFTTKERGKGTGLGLSTVYGIVKQSGGNISVYSEVDRGTVFKIYLPRIDESPDTPRQAISAGVPHGDETILLVEDEPTVRDFVAAALRRLGYTVVEAEDGHKALRVAEEFPGRIDLLLTDVVMPRMSGPELAERFRVLREHARVLYISGYTGDAIVHHGILEFGPAFLQKPFTPEALARKVREALD